MSVLTLALVADVVLKATLVLGLAGLAAARSRTRLRRHPSLGLDAGCRGRAPGARPARHRAALGAAAAARHSDRRAPRVLRRARRARRRRARGNTGAAEKAMLPRPIPRRSPPRAGLDPRSLLGFVWLAGALLVAAPLLVGTAPRLRARPAPRGVLVAATGPRCCATSPGRSRSGAPVRLLRGRPKSMPMAWGLLRPAVVLPEDAEGWSVEQRRAVLTHELGHVKRHDCLTQALAQAACAVYWFHPLAWIAAWRLRVERERACDDLVLRAGASGPDYADHLLQLARGARARAGPAWALAMARPSQLEGRLLAILDPSLDRRGPTRARPRSRWPRRCCWPSVLAGLEPWERPVSASTSLAFETLGADGLASTPRPAQEAGRAAGAVQSTPPPSPQRPARRESPTADSVVAALAEAVRDSDPEVRRQAVHSLGEMRAEGAARRSRVRSRTRTATCAPRRPLRSAR